MVLIDRIYQDDCTVGILTCGAFRCMTLELPDLGNEKNVSCIPEGLYKCKKIASPSLGKCIEIQGVVNRSYVRIHKGNFTRQIHGCVLVGDSIADIDKDGILDVVNSIKTINNLLAILPNEFELTIKG